MPVLMIGWTLLGLLVGLGLDPLARWVAGELGPACPHCGADEPGSRWSGLARALGPGGWRCRGCGGRASLWLASAGPLLALIFGLLAARWPPGRELVVASLYATVLVLVAALDLRHRLVYPLVTYPATVGAIGLTPWAFDLPPWSGLAGALVGAAIFLAFYGLAILIYRHAGALGLGDVMIGGLIGAMVGLSNVGGAVGLGVILGGLNGLVVMLARRSRRAHFAYGPALCLGGLVALLQ